MVPATVVACTFILVAVITWLSSRADASRARCEDLAQHIRRQLECPSTRRSAAGTRRRH